MQLYTVTVEEYAEMVKYHISDVLLLYIEDCEKLVISRKDSQQIKVPQEEAILDHFEETDGTVFG